MGTIQIDCWTSKKKKKREIMLGSGENEVAKDKHGDS